MPLKWQLQMLQRNYIKCKRCTHSMVRHLAATYQLLTIYGSVIAWYDHMDDTRRQAMHTLSLTPSRERLSYKTNQLPLFTWHPQPKWWPSCSRPTSLNSMCWILLQFCTFAYGLSTDIEKSFLQVGLDKDKSDLPDLYGYLTLRIWDLDRRKRKVSSKSTRLFCLTLSAPDSCSM